MKNLLENFKVLFGRPDPSPHGLKVNLIRSKIAIRKALLECAQKDQVVGVYCPALSGGMLLVGVDDFSLDHSEPVIIFKNYEMNGISLSRTRVSLSEIRSICVFDSVYESPLPKGPVMS
jgi:hypothetical protein